MSSKPTLQKEFQVRIPKTTNKRLTILKFNESLNVRPQRWNLETLRMEREDNRRAGMSVAGDIMQEFGEGSEYGKAAREEARLKKFGRQLRKYEHDKQPWRLSIEQQFAATDDDGNNDSKDKATGTSAVTTTKVRKFRSMREAGAGEHADYWIFYKSGNDLEAYKVDEWYQFLPAVTYKYLDAEQAEERFKERDKVFNQFALKAQIQRQLAEQEDNQRQILLQQQQQGGPLKREKGLKIKDEASSGEEQEEDEDGEEKGRTKNGSKKTKGGNNTKKASKKGTATEKRGDKKQRVEAGDEVAAYESEDGEDEGREYDYMSDSGSDSEREELDVDQKMEDDLVGVEDESGLRGALESDEEGDEEGEDEEEKEDERDDKKEQTESAKPVKEQSEDLASGEKEVRPKAVRVVDKMMAQGGSNKFDVEPEGDESMGSESDEDPDSSKIKSVLFMQDKRKVPGTTSSTSSQLNQQRKRPEPSNDAPQQPSTSTVKTTSDPEVKRPKMASSDESEFEAISESFIRKLLERRPHSTKQLLTKVNQRFQQQKQDAGQAPPAKDKKIVAQLAEILKKIEPYQFRKKNEAGKDVLFFSMNRTA